MVEEMNHPDTITLRPANPLPRVRSTSYGSDPFAYDLAPALALSERELRRRAAPAVQRFVKHASRFGTECVYETAQHEGLSDAELRSLDGELSRIDTKRRRLFPDDARSELDADIVRLVETLPVARVALRVGKSKSYVYSVLRNVFEPGSASSMSRKEAA
jgi:hypothetical protein